MRRSLFTEQQIIGLLKQTEAGPAVKEVCRQGGLSEPTFYKWRAKYGGMDAEEARRLRELAVENARLKKLLAEAHLVLEAIKIGFGCKALALQDKRKASARMLEHARISERRTCRRAGLSRDAWRCRRSPVPARLGCASASTPWPCGGGASGIAVCMTCCAASFQAPITRRCIASTASRAWRYASATRPGSTAVSELRSLPPCVPTRTGAWTRQRRTGQWPANQMPDHHR